MSKKEKECKCMEGEECTCGENCTCEKDKCCCGEDCKCGENCTCGENCKCGENCTCGEDCDCKDDCCCGHDCDCEDDCCCGHDCDCEDDCCCEHDCDCDDCCDDHCGCGCDDCEPQVTEAELKARMNILVDDYSTSEVNQEMILEKGRKLAQEDKYEEAVEYYQEAAVLGNATAICNLAHCYLNGKGVKKDVNKAKTYYELACKLGVPNAMYKLGDLYKEGIGADVNKERAVCLYQLAFDTAFFAKDPWSMPDAALRLAKEKLSGEVIEQDVDDAEFLLQIAASMFADRSEFDSSSEEGLKECEDLLSRIIEE